MLLILGAIALVVLLIWMFNAQVPVLKVSPTGRIEPHNSIHRIEPSVAGRVIRSQLVLDQMVEKGDTLIVFESRPLKLELQENQASQSALTKELLTVEQQIENKEQELNASASVDALALREAEARRSELSPRLRLARQRAELARESPAGTISELEKLERITEADALAHTKRTQKLGLTRLRREQAVRREALTAELLALKREAVQIRGQLELLAATIERLEHQIEETIYRAPASGRLIDVAELAEGAFIVPGQRLGSILATESPRVRVRARFPKETVGVIRRGQRARLKLDGYPWTIYGTVPARVTRVGTEPGRSQTPEAVPGTVRIELEIDDPTDPRVRLEHGMTATVEIEFARVSPFALLMRAIGQWDYEAPSDLDEKPSSTFVPENKAY